MDYCYKYCIAEVRLRGAGAAVSYAGTERLNGEGGMCLWVDFHDPHVIWYDTEEEAKQHLMNSNDCVVSKLFENGVIAR